MHPVASPRGEGAKAIIVRGEAEDRLVPFVFEGSTHLVPAGFLRHHPNHPDCPWLTYESREQAAS